MKKIAFAAALAATTAFAMPAYATNSQTVISGDVALSCNITGPADATGLDLSGPSSTSLGTLAANCNSSGGFTASVSSDNSGKLKDTSHPSNPTYYPYTLSAPTIGYNNVSLTSPVSFTAPAGTPAFSTGVAVTLNIGNRNGQDFAGHYQDVLRWSITAN